MKMDIHSLIIEIRTQLKTTFAEVDEWFDKEKNLMNYKPADGGWSVAQVLEHIGLTNFFLLKLIDKGTNKALQNANKLNLEEELKHYIFHRDQLTEVGLHRSFTWMRPEHMEPGGAKSMPEVRMQLKEQLYLCLDYLDKLKNGEGVLYKTMMSVNNLGKIDVYEYIYFLARHASRHVAQMEKLEKEFNSVENRSR